MRILIFIALLCVAAQGRGQIYINSYAFGAGAPSGDLLLDSLSDVIVAFSLRKLDKDYTGSAIRVRRSNDNAEQDIGFVSDYLDTASLKTFVGANSGFVVTWYNQSDSSGTFGIRNATQATAGNQPRIVNAGALEYQNGEIAIAYQPTSANGPLTIDNSTSTFNCLHDTTSATVVIVAAVGTTTNPAFDRVLLRTSGGTTTVGMVLYYDDAGAENDAIAVQVNKGVSALPAVLNVSANNAFAANTQRLLFATIDANNATAANRSVININNGTDIKNNVRTEAPNNGNSTNNFTIGDGLFGSGSVRYQEIIVFSNDKTADKTLIHNNINTFYSIY